jgi:DNA-directed RNA polymerase II subunit RPB2
MEIRICTDRARPSRPLLVVKNLHQMQKLHHQVQAGQPIVWMNLIRDGLVDYIDKCEEADFDIVIATDLYQALHCKASTKDREGMPFTHVEIHGLAVCGISSGLIPFTNFNQGPRNTYGSAMSRQAMASSSTSSSKHRMDLSSVQFWYPQVPLAKTVLSSVLGFDMLPNGQNHDFLILTTGKEAQEDAQIDNLSCHDRGFSRFSVYRTITVGASTIAETDATETFNFKNKNKLTAAEKTKIAKSIVPGQETFKKISPEQTLRPKLADYTQIEDADGLINAGKNVYADTVIAQKVSKIPPMKIPGGTIDAHGIDEPDRWITEKDNSEIVKSFSTATITKVALCNDNKGDVVAKIGVAQNRRMERGDKQANRHGQKGTLGRLTTQENMPFTRYGRNDVTILSDFAFPSRMLWADIIEKYINIIAGALGVRADATPFSTGYRQFLVKVIDEKLSQDGQGFNKDEREFLKRYAERGHSDEFSDETETKIQERVTTVFSRVLMALGFHPYGEETMYSGETGKRLHGRMFSSSGYKLILRHIAGWKLRSRQEGERDRLTQQPVSGKNRNGGLKVNVMERDALLASGATEVVQNLLVVSSDPGFIIVCKECNCNCIYGNVTHRTYCKVCDKYDTGLKIDTTAGTILTQQEMGAVGINLQMMVAPA